MPILDRHPLPRVDALYKLKETLTLTLTSHPAATPEASLAGMKLFPPTVLGEFNRSL